MSDKETAPRIYAASRASVPERPRMWQSLRKSGVNIISSWIDEAMPGETADLSELWVRIAAEIASADCLVLYVEPTDFPLKGAFIEVGIALALGKPVRVVTPGMEFDAPGYQPIGSWIKHPSVELFKDVKQACRVAVESRAPAPQLTEILTKYGAHHIRDCDALNKWKKLPCDCGFAALIRGTSEQASPTPEEKAAKLAELKQSYDCGNLGWSEAMQLYWTWHSSPGTTKGTTKD